MGGGGGGNGNYRGEISDGYSVDQNHTIGTPMDPSGKSVEGTRENYLIIIKFTFII